MKYVQFFLGLIVLAIYFRIFWVVAMDRPVWMKTWNWKSKLVIFTSLPMFLLGLGLVFSIKP